MTPKEIQEKYPKTCKDIKEFLSSSINFKFLSMLSNLYSLRHYFDSVGIISILIYDGYNANWEGYILYGSTSSKPIKKCRHRSEAEKAVILKAFEIREKELNNENKQ